MKKITSTTALVDCLVDNNRFSTRKLTADHIGAENLRNWKDLIADLHKGAYSIYVKCENDDLTVATQNMDLTPVFEPLRAIMAELGEVNGHKMTANAEIATAIIGYSGKRANSDSPELQFCLSQISNRNTELRKLEELNGVNPDTITALKTQLEELEAQKSDLLNAPDNRIKKPTRTTAETFRLDVEHRIARAINGQLAKSWEELELEAEAKRQAKRAKTAEKRAKAKAEAQTNA